MMAKAIFFSVLVLSVFPLFFGLRKIYLSIKGAVHSADECGCGCSVEHSDKSSAGGGKEN